MPASTSKTKYNRQFPPAPSCDRIDRNDLIARLTEHDVESVYRSLGVEKFKPGGPGNWLVSRPWQSEPEKQFSVTVRKLDGVWSDKARDEGGSIIDAVMRVQRCDFPEALQFVADIAGVRTEPSNGHKVETRRVKYRVRDSDGRHVANHVRIEYSDGSKRFTWERPDGQSGLGGIPVTNLPLYGIDQLTDKPGVVMVEGEQAQEALAGIDVQSVATVTGASTIPADGVLISIIDRIVYLWPDNDQDGRNHMHKIAARLATLGCETIHMVSWPDAPPKGDAADYVARGASKADVRALLKASPAWNPDAEPEPEEAEPVSDEPETSVPAAPAWPDPLRPEAYYGLAGEIVRALEPETEADLAGLLLSLLTVVGNIVGAGPHWRVGGARHGLRLNVIQIGPTSGGRKGTSWGALKPIIKVAAADWLDRNVKSGLSSGEGLIWAVRDEIRKTEPVKEKGRIIDYQEVVVDPGIEDKRLLVIEQEFASTLKVMTRDSNILSAVIRQAWDDGDLRTLTKNNPVTATGAQISIIGHITQDELLRYLDNTEAGNAFANRFLFACVKRSKQLPDGGEFDQGRIDALGKRLAAVFNVAKEIDLITRDDEAAAMWRVVYGPLSEGGVGLMGAVLARAEAQVMRLAAIYAVLDQSCTISAPHLKAALAVWQYIEASTKYIFGDALGDPIADAILHALRGGDQSRTQIRDLFDRHVSRSRVDRALGMLAASGKAVRVLDRETGGRPKEIWRAIRCDKSDKSDKSP